MYTASISEIKKELNHLSKPDLINVCLQLAKYKKENKELITYLLFNAVDETTYIADVKKLMDEQFAEMNSKNTYLAKKTIRKVLRSCNKYIKYSKIPNTEIELRIYFCTLLKNSEILSRTENVIKNMYANQFTKIKGVISKLHEDQQSDYDNELKKIRVSY